MTAADPHKDPPASTADGPTGPALLLDRLRPGRLVSGTVLLGLAGSILMAVCAVGAAGILTRDPMISGGPLAWVRYGHGRDLATGLLYLGFGLLVWAWVRLGRDVLAERAGSRQVLTAAALWIAPVLVSPPLFTRDVYSYLAQGALALQGLDPYEVGPVELGPGPVADNVHYVWQTTPAPYGPLFLLISQGVYGVTRDTTIAGVILMRLVLLAGLALLLYALPRLTRLLGGSVPVTLWLVVASPMMVVHLVGGPHNDLLMIGLLASGTLLVLHEKHAAGIAVVSVAMAVKATAGIALPFLVWIWAGRMSGRPLVRFGKAAAAGLGVYAVTFALATLVSGVGSGWISAISAPSLIVNWMSLPTGAGQIVYHVTNLFADVEQSSLVDVFRLLGSAVLALVALRQWWLARRGGTGAVRRAAIVLLWAALLAPWTFPWYLTWSLVLGAGLAWSRRALTVLVAASTWLVLSAYPTGESPLNSWPYVTVTIGVSVLAGVSLLRTDPLRLRGRRRPDPAPDAEPDGQIEPATANAEARAE